MHALSKQIVRWVGGLSFLLVSLSITSRDGQAIEPLVADLDNHLVAITAGFTGTEILVFGSIEEEGDVVVVVHGPKQQIVARRKDRVAGIWVNADAVIFDSVPAFYHVAMTDPDEELDLPASALRRHQIGIDNIRMTALDAQTDDMEAVFEEAVIRNKINVGHYSEEPGVVERRGGRLFRTSILVPANVPVGTYVVETMLVVDGQVVGAQTTPLFVNKEGLGAQVFIAAHQHSALYGIVAIVIAVFAGLAANWIFQKL